MTISSANGGQSLEVTLGAERIDLTIFADEFEAVLDRSSPADGTEEIRPFANSARLPLSKHARRPTSEVPGAQ
ncbi:MAG: hypothetical protein DWQ56_11225 [Microcystis aeruginosa DA14]|uniref:Uncharacterized protein n=1 Tax=Microcystis aeruginosa DA14 TaxID=1987506 RepID=A0A3E0ME13_MICAE|nr:MAG: hypothetical protein DWQ56_11225 [Microcystis aeruginosa DA14]